ncbi:MAG: hypothetical protein QOE45_209 [Frankiaceae bacterium]|jgi:uncharacterized protein YcnI|nr:hypothetical protein [Frankiaceae bacterium]
MSRTRRAATLALVAVAAAALPASAHVTVNPSTAEQGGFAKLSFRVPTEKDDASTTRLEVNLPADHPVASVSVKPHAGWTFTVTKTTLAKPIQSDDGAVTEAVTKILWSGGRIAPGEFDEFDVSVGPLPTDTDELVFKTVQGYSDGSVVRWIDLRTPGGTEPEHPAPVLHLVAKAGSTPSPSASAAAATPAPNAVSVSAADVRGAKRTARTGVALGAAALALAVVGLARRRRA